MKRLIIVLLALMAQLSVHGALRDYETCALIDWREQCKVQVQVKLLENFLKNSPFDDQSKPALYRTIVEVFVKKIPVQRIIEKCIEYAWINSPFDMDRFYDVCKTCAISLSDNELSIYQQQLETLNEMEKEVFVAIQKKDFDTVLLCLENGARINAQDDEGYCVLFVSIINSDGQVERIQQLLQRSTVNSNIASHFGDTPLKVAAMYNYPGIVQLLSNRAATVIPAEMLTLVQERNYSDVVEVLSADQRIEKKGGCIVS